MVISKTFTGDTYDYVFDDITDVIEGIVNSRDTIKRRIVTVSHSISLDPKGPTRFKGSMIVVCEKE